MTICGQVVIFSWLTVIYNLYRSYNIIKNSSQYANYLKKVFFSELSTDQYLYYIGFLFGWFFTYVISIICAYIVTIKCSKKHGEAMHYISLALFLFPIGIIILRIFGN